jgi:hypothetical protein
MKVKYFEDYSTQSVSSSLGNLARKGGDRYLATVNPADLVEWYYDQYSLPRLILQEGGSPQIQAGEATSKHTEADTAKVTIRFNVEQAPRIERALALVDKDEPPHLFKTDKNGFYVNENLSVESAKSRIKELSQQILPVVNRRNSQIEATNADFRSRVNEVITQRYSRLQQQGETIKRLAQLIPIEIRPQPTAPIVPLAKKKEITINPPKRIGTFQAAIDPGILNAIIDILIRGGRTFETTPSTFAKLDEEDLRNLLLSFLNGNFEIRAVGEAFNKKGKTDISLAFSGDNLFITECKFWDGLKKYQDAIDQLFRYLTWRETFGVLIFFVKERDFSSVIERAKDSAKSHRTYIEGSFRPKDASYFLTSHVFPDDNAKTVRVHHLLFHIPASGD